MASRPPNFPPDIPPLPDDFDLDVQFKIPKYGGKDFHLFTEVGCGKITLGCPHTGCICAGATGIDTGGGATCFAYCQKTRNLTCDKPCMITAYNHICEIEPIKTRFKKYCFTKTCFIGGCGGTPPGTNTPECG